MEKFAEREKDFLELYEINEKQTVEDLIKQRSFSESELIGTISHLISHRELMRDFELENLQIEADKFMEKLNGAKKKQLLEEIKCFKEIIALQKQLLKLKKDES